MRDSGDDQTSFCNDVQRIMCSMFHDANMRAAVLYGLHRMSRPFADSVGPCIVQCPETNGQDPKKIKARMSFRFDEPQTEGAFSSETSNRHESLPESKSSSTNL